MPGQNDGVSPYVLAPLRGNRPPAPSWFEEAVSAPVQQIPFEWDGAAIELLAWGEVGKPGLLLLHGNNSHARWWSPIAAKLAGSFRVAALSWSGMGGSDWRSAYSIAAYADEAMAAARAAGLHEAGPPVVVAHSFGGGPALEAALHHGGELAGVILLDTLLAPGAGKPDVPSRAADRFYPSEEAALARFRLAPPQPCDNLYYMDWVARHALRQVKGGEGEGEGGWAWRIDPSLWPKLVWHDKWRAYTDCRCPLAVVRGDASRLVTAEKFEAQKTAAPAGTHFEVLTGAGHHLLLDQPLALAELIGRISRQMHQ